MASSNKITITVKTPKDKQTIEISEDADIKEVSKRKKKLIKTHFRERSLEKKEISDTTTVILRR